MQREREREKEQGKQWANFSVTLFLSLYLSLLPNSLLKDGLLDEGSVRLLLLVLSFESSCTGFRFAIFARERSCARMQRNSSAMRVRARPRPILSTTWNRLGERSGEVAESRRGVSFSVSRERFRARGPAGVGRRRRRREHPGLGGDRRYLKLSRGSAHPEAACVIRINTRHVAQCILGYSLARSRQPARLYATARA